MINWILKEMNVVTARRLAAGKVITDKAVSELESLLKRQSFVLFSFIIRLRISPPSSRTLYFCPYWSEESPSLAQSTESCFILNLTSTSSWNHRYKAFVCLLNCGRISSVGSALECRGGSRGFVRRGRTNTQGLKITEKWRYSLALQAAKLNLRVARMNW